MSMVYIPNLRRKPIVTFVLWVALASATLMIFAYAHVKAGFTLPNPWNDEPWYLWSTISLAENNTFFSESLNPERVVPLSPAYQVPMALLFKVTGFSFGLARWVSWGYMALAYLGVLWLVKSRPLPLLSAGVASLFFLGASSVVAGNMCRPEAMVWAIAVWSFVLADRGSGWKALSLAGIGAMVHQVGVMFFAGVLFVALWQAWPFGVRCRPRGTDWLAIGLAVAILIGQGLFLWQHWEWVLADSRSAAGESMGPGIFRSIFASNKTPWVGLSAGLVALSLWKLRSLLVPTVLGGISLATMLVRPQMWYEVYNQMAFMWLTLLIPWTGWLVAKVAMNRFAPTGCARLRLGLCLLAFGAGLLPMLKLGYAHGFITGPNHYPAKLGWGWGMRMDSAPYITEQDVSLVAQEIEKHVADGNMHRVFFMPEGDALFFVGKLPPNVVPYQGVRTSVQGDMAVFRLSRHPPEWWTIQHVKKTLALWGGDDLTPFYERDGTEKWILIPEPPVPAADLGAADDEPPS